MTNDKKHVSVKRWYPSENGDMQSHFAGSYVSYFDHERLINLAREHIHRLTERAIKAGRLAERDRREILASLGEE